MLRTPLVILAAGAAAAALLATVYPLLSLAAFVATRHGKDSDYLEPSGEP